jgi:hypothetical protein
MGHQRKLFIVGAQKAGTTALHAYLSRHADVTMSANKELHFFDDDTLDWTSPPYERWESHFARARTSVIGEATPIYCYWPNAIKRLRAYDPEARIIMLLRHPTFRAHSHWRMQRKRNIEPLSFGDAIAEGRRRLTDMPEGDRFFSYVERGFYSDQVERILSLFPRDHVLFIRTDDLWRSLAATFANVERFLGVEPILSPQQKYIVAASTDVAGELAPALRRRLDRIYESDIHRTAALTGLSLDDWLSPAYAEPDGLAGNSISSGEAAVDGRSRSAWR